MNPPSGLGSRPLILIVEDELDLADLVRRHLEGEGYECQCCPSGDAAIEAVRRRPPSLILLDRMLPGVSGDEVAARLKHDAETLAIPIIMLTAKADESDQLVGFALGANDYVTKPFSMKILTARIAALLRRAAQPSDKDDTQRVGPFRLSLSRHEVTVDGEIVALTFTEFHLLVALMKARGRVLDRPTLIDLVLGQDTVVIDRTIDVHVTALRKKLGGAAAWVQTVRGVGYTFREPLENPARQP